MNDQALQQQAWHDAMGAGSDHYQQGRLLDAGKAFAKAVQLSPERVEGWINLASTLLEAKRFDDALVALERANALNPSLMVSHMLTGDVLRQLGHWPEALTSYRRAVSLQRAPLALNRLACALRVEKQPEEAEKLYREALQAEPRFTLAQVNLATTQIELGSFDEAGAQLRALASAPLSPPERAEVDSAQVAIAEYFRLDGALTALTVDDDPAPLESALRDTPEKILQVDEPVLDKIRNYAASAGRLPTPSPIEAVELPGEWPLIEALFMIPHVNSVSEYREVKAGLDNGMQATGDLLESTNMEAAIRAARTARQDLLDPVKAELHLRHWHALACRGVPGFMPGHFKYTSNWAASNPGLKRVDPALASGSVRHYISDIYPDLAPGVARAALACMAVCDLHAFADGNGRVAITWLNRELEWAGLMPALFSRELGFKGKLLEVRKEVTKNSGDLSPLLSLIADAQLYALEFCAELGAA